MSHGIRETHWYSASQDKLETQSDEASHGKEETHSMKASQSKIEVHHKVASHRNGETQYSEASHVGQEPHSITASQTRLEAQLREARHRTAGAHGDASQIRLETQATKASQKREEPQSIVASQEITEAQMNGADLVSIERNLRNLVRVHDDVQKDRIRVGNRLSRFYSDDLDYVHDELRRLEKDIKRRIERAAASHPVWEERGQYIQGLGPYSLAVFLGEVDIEKADTVSSMWKYCGLHTVEGKAARRVRGRKGGYNPILKTHAWQVSTNFVRQRPEKSGYRRLYDRFKKRYAETRGSVPQTVPLDEAVGEILVETIGPVKAGTKLKKKVKKGVAPFEKLVRYCREHGITAVPIVWCPLHVHEAARRRMAKIFIEHLWEVWRKARGLPIRPPYVIEQLGHKDYIRPFRDK